MANRRFDLVNFSNTWQYTRQDGQDRREVEDSLLAANKVLKIGGYVSIVLGKSNTSEDAFNEIAYTLLPRYNFKPIVAGKFGGRVDSKRIYDTSWFIS